MDRQDMLKLAERCEQATGPDRELDALIGKSVAAQPFAICDTGNVPIFASYTASLDAAMTLVPEGMDFAVGSIDPLTGKGGPCAGVGTVHKAEEGRAATPALALCAAALRSRANLNDKSGEGDNG